jgi:ketosteroid isomerase-like protein
VVSTPVPVAGVVVVGSRGYDLVGLDVATGRELWRRYIWYSWIESNAAARGGVAYLGSSDAARVFALDPKTGKSLWEADVFGITWGQPAVTGRRVFAGVQGSHGLVEHAAGAFALDRASGRVLWQFPVAEPVPSKPWGFAGSPAVGAGRVFLAGLDGKLYAFDADAPALPSVPLPPDLDRVLRDYEKAWGARDAAALAKLFTEDGFVLSSDSPPVKGRAAIEKHYQGAGGPLYLRAFAFESNASTGFILGGYRHQEKGPDSGKFTLTLRQGTHGRWLIVSDMDNGNWGE